VNVASGLGPLCTKRHENLARANLLVRRVDHGPSTSSSCQLWRSSAGEVDRDASREARIQRVGARVDRGLTGLFHRAGAPRQDRPASTPSISRAAERIGACRPSAGWQHHSIVGGRAIRACAPGRTTTSSRSSFRNRSARGRAGVAARWRGKRTLVRRIPAVCRHSVSGRSAAARQRADARSGNMLPVQARCPFSRNTYGSQRRCSTASCCFDARPTDRR